MKSKEIVQKKPLTNYDRTCSRWNSGDNNQSRSKKKFGRTTNEQRGHNYLQSELNVWIRFYKRHRHQICWSECLVELRVHLTSYGEYCHVFTPMTGITLYFLLSNLSFLTAINLWLICLSNNTSHSKCQVPPLCLDFFNRQSYEKKILKNFGVLKYYII